MNFMDFFISEANHNILRIKISVDHLAHSMHVVQANQALSCKSSHKRKRHSFIVISFDYLQEIHSQDFKHHYEMLSIWSMMNERIQKLGAMRTFGHDAVLFKSSDEMLVILVISLYGSKPLICLPVFSNLVKDVDFII